MATCPTCGMPAPHDGPCPRPVGQGSSRNIVLQGRYELIGLLGQGGMGTVYMARDMRLHNRPCVVKKLRDDFYRDEDRQKAVAFFDREAGVLSRLQHPNIVHILDYFEENHDYFLVMEYVEGRDLHNILLERGEAFAEEQVLDWAVQICDVLEYLHGHDPPVIYRDLKPSNIMLDVKGRIKLVDFGIARRLEEGSDNTHVVSAGFSPPEQYWGAADPRSDIYALGTTMYFLLTCKEPVALHPSSPRTDNPEISENTEEIVQRATTQDANLRYQSAEEFRQALENRPVVKRKLEPSNKSDILIGAAVLAIAAGGYFAYQQLDKVLDLRNDQPKTNEQSVSKEAKENEQLQKKLKQYSRAQEATDEAMKEWRNLASSKAKAKSDHAKATHANLAAQAVGEAQLTDPEGMAPLPEQSSQSTGSLPQ